jgi:hypothetical protein
MKKLIIIFCALALTNAIVFAQGCLPEGIIFTTQEQIDNFQVNYPGCTEIEGSVKISDDWSGDITNLNGLSMLTSIGGALFIDANVSLTDINGLSNLYYIGNEFPFYGLSITNNSSLTSLAGLENITMLFANLEIANNDNLTSLSGLHNLNSIEAYGSIYIEFNASLTNLSGLENLEYVDGYFFISENASLTDFTGLNNQLSINRDLVIRYNDNMTSLTGLEGLYFIGNNLIIDSNSGLGSLTGLENVTLIDGYIAIENNDNLISLSGLENIDANSIIDINIFDNNSLSYCDVYSICQYLASPNGTIEIHDNAPGCNSQEEVEAACLTSIRDNIAKEEITLFPNPATSFITINVTGGQPIAEAIIYNHLGQKALVAVPVNNTVDVSTLKSGIYFIEVATKEWKGRTKLIMIN